MEMHDECMAWLILFQFDDFAFAGDAENFELIACRVVLPWGFFFLIRRFGQRVGQDPDPCRSGPSSQDAVSLLMRMYEDII